LTVFRRVRRPKKWCDRDDDDDDDACPAPEDMEQPGCGSSGIFEVWRDAKPNPATCLEDGERESKRERGKRRKK